MRLPREALLEAAKQTGKFPGSPLEGCFWFVHGENRATLFTIQSNGVHYLRTLPVTEPFEGVCVNGETLASVMSCFVDDEVRLTRQGSRMRLACNGKSGSIGTIPMEPPAIPVREGLETVYTGPTFLTKGTKAVQLFGRFVDNFGQLAIFPEAGYAVISQRGANIYGAHGSGRWRGTNLLVPSGVMALSSVLGNEITISHQVRAGQAPLVWFEDGTRSIVCTPSSMSIPPYPSVLNLFFAARKKPFPLAEVLTAAKDCVHVAERANVQVRIGGGNLTVETVQDALQNTHFRATAEVGGDLAIHFSASGRALVAVLSLLHGENPEVSLTAGAQNSHLCVQTTESFVVLNCLAGSLRLE